MILTIFFFFNDTATTEIYTLSLHDALPICHHHVIVSGLGQPRGEPRVATAARIVVLGSLALEARAEQEDVGVEHVRLEVDRHGFAGTGRPQSPLLRVRAVGGEERIPGRHRVPYRPAHRDPAPRR